MQNSELFQVATLPGWDLNISGDHLSLKAPGRIEAEEFLEIITDSLSVAASAFGFKYGYLTFPDCKKPYKIPASIFHNCSKYESQRKNFMTQTPLIVVPGLEIAQMKLSLPILRIFQEFCEYPDQRSGLVRINDERQVAMSESSSMMIVNSTLQAAVQRKRNEYWHLADLEEFNREWQRNLTLDDGSSFEFAYRCVSADKTSWRRFTTRYRLVSDSYGILYHVSSNVGVDEITAPVEMSV